MSDIIPPGIRGLTMSYLMDNGQMDNAPKLALDAYKPAVQRGRDPWGGEPWSPRDDEVVLFASQTGGGGGESGAQPEAKAPDGGGSEVRGTIDPGGVGEARGTIHRDQAGADPYAPGPGHVPHQDDWLNPDTSKLPPTSKVPTYGHVITSEEARNVPTALGLALVPAGTYGAAIASTAKAAAHIAAATGTGSYILGGLKGPSDLADKLLTGRVMQLPDPASNHLDNQAKGYSD